MAQKTRDGKHWTQKISRSGYFFGAVLLHLIVFVMVATWVVFPAFKAPVDDFAKTYLPPPAPPPPPPQVQQAVEVPTHAVAPPTAVISTTAATVNFNIPMPDFTHQATPDEVSQKLTAKVNATPNNLPMRLAKIMETEKGWGRDANNIRQSGGDPHNVRATFPLFLAAYADGDWGCNVELDRAGKISGGSLTNFVNKMNEWSHGQITGTVIPTPLNIGGPDLLDKKPPFIFFTGHKDFHLTDPEIQNLRDYLQVGGAIWGDNSLAGRGSRFDVAFRREMKRVVPDADKNFEPAAMTHDMFTKKGWFQIAAVPQGMNYYDEPIEHLDIDGKLAILYTPNDYGDLFFVHIMPGDTVVDASWPYKFPLHTNITQWRDRTRFYRNLSLESSLAAQQLGMNIIGYLLVRFDEELQLTP